MAAINKTFNVQDRLILTKNFGKSSENYLRKNIFDTDPVGHGVSVTSESQPYIFMFNEKCHCSRVSISGVLVEVFD